MSSDLPRGGGGVAVRFRRKAGSPPGGAVDTIQSESNDTEFRQVISNLRLIRLIASTTIWS